MRASQFLSQFLTQRSNYREVIYYQRSNVIGTCFWFGGLFFAELKIGYANTLVQEDFRFTLICDIESPVAMDWFVERVALAIDMYRWY